MTTKTTLTHQPASPLWRLAAAMSTEARVQKRNGFYYASIFIVVLFVVLLTQIPRQSVNTAALVPGFLVLNVIVTTFYFVAGLVLLEKSEGVLSGLVVSPLRPAEYLWAKAITLTALAAAESLLIVIAGFGMGFNILPLAVGMLALGAVYTFTGFAAIARFDSINTFILPSGLLVAVLALPLLDHLALVQSPLFYLHPVQPALVLLRAAFAPAEAWQIAYGVVGSLGWGAVSYVLARRAFTQIVEKAG